MGNDEEKAFDLLKKNRELQKPIIEQFNGRWIKELGDGVMASFNTVSDAVNAAIKIQKDCNAAKGFQLRIGIHLGEVVFENEDVFGDGVNIASRIQSAAKPGSIYVSESVHNNVSNKKDIQTKFVKEETLKNVKDPVKIYEVITANSPAPPDGEGEFRKRSTLVNRVGLRSAKSFKSKFNRRGGETQRISHKDTKGTKT
jgi:adenylate cyclase